MERKGRIAVTALLSSGLLATGPGPVSGQAVPEAFGVADVTGAYVSTLSGQLFPDPTNPLQAVPLAALVRYCADGLGNADVTLVQNIGGVCVQRAVGTATYAVASDGLDAASATLTTVEASPGCGQLVPPVTVGGQTSFETAFVIDAAEALHQLTTALQIPAPPSRRGRANAKRRLHECLPVRSQGRRTLPGPGTRLSVRLPVLSGRLEPRSRPAAKGRLLPVANPTATVRNQH